MKDMNFKNWTDDFAQSVLSAVRKETENEPSHFLKEKLKQAVRSLDSASHTTFLTDNPTEYHKMLCVVLNEARNCVFWLERSKEYEQVNSQEADRILNHGKSIVETLEASLRVINYQKNLN